MTEPLKEITAQDAKKHLDVKSANFIDIRDPESYKTAHIEGATQLHDGNIEEFVASADKDAQYVVYCFHGNSSKGAAGFLTEKGFKNVFSMIGGYADWESQFPA